MLKGAETELVELLAVRLDDSGEDEGGTIKCLFRSSPGAYMAKMDRDGASDCCCKAWGVELNGVCPAQCMYAGVTARQRVCICNAPCRFSSKLLGANGIGKHAV